MTQPDERPEAARSVPDPETGGGSDLHGTAREVVEGEGTEDNVAPTPGA
jgi:hypothetical protein